VLHASDEKRREARSEERREELGVGTKGEEKGQQVATSETTIVRGKGRRVSLWQTPSSGKRSESRSKWSSTSSSSPARARSPPQSGPRQSGWPRRNVTAVSGVARHVGVR